jgi:putative transposase
MARPLRLELAGALYHVTARGNERRSIFLGNLDDERAAFLDVLAATCDRFNWICHAYCLMTNHYHLLVETPDANLSKGMRQLNGVYTQYVNRRHGRVQGEAALTEDYWSQQGVGLDSGQRPARQV